eukprot:TCALIF_13765-PA protein Name:"Protein of unknown function" AED:0.15 eAED:0.17 QI:0/0/0/0.87/0.28/0.25/8/0/966
MDSQHAPQQPLLPDSQHVAPIRSAHRSSADLKPSRLTDGTDLTNFNSWRKAVIDYFAASRINTLPIMDQRAHLCVLMDICMDNTLHLLLDVQDTDDVKTALDALETHIKNEISLITWRVNFQRCPQKQGEGFNDYYLRLRLIGDNADLDGMSYEDRLAQHLVATVSNRELQADLLKMPTHALLEIRTKCMQWESPAANQRDLDVSPSGSVLATSSYRREKNTILQHRARSQSWSKAFSEQGPRAGNDGCCIWCGSQMLHPHVNCQAFGKNCHCCQDRGHLSHRCLVGKGSPHNEKSPEKYSNQSQFQRKGRTNAIRTKILAIRGMAETPAAVMTFMTKLGQTITHEVVPDTGATDTIINSNLLRRSGIPIDGTYQSRKLLFAANGDEMQCHGTVEFAVRFRDRTTTNTAYACPNVDGILVSWHTLQDLRIIGRFFPLNDVEEGLIEPLSCSQAIQKGLVVADEAAEVRQIKPAKCVTFSETDSHENLLDSVPLDPTPRGDQLQQCTTAGKVPIDYHDLAKAEIDRMLSNGIICPMIGPSKWLSSFLIAAKPGGGVRLVVNFKELNKMDLPTALWTNASLLNEFGFALMQNHGKPNQEHWRLITCGSRFLTSTESRYAAIEAELQAIVSAISKCHMYLAGISKFIRAGRAHCVADALSRSPVLPPPENDEVAVLGVICGRIQGAENDPERSNIDRLRQAALADQDYCEMVECLKAGVAVGELPPIILEDYILNYGLFLLLKKASSLLIAPEFLSQLQHAILDLLHTSHQGRDRTLRRARQLYLWRGMSKDIQRLGRASVFMSSMLLIRSVTTTRNSLDSTCAKYDLFEYGGHCFIVICDQYSGWPLLKSYGKRSPCADDEVQTMLGAFTMFGFPDKITTDATPLHTKVDPTVCSLAEEKTDKVNLKQKWQYDERARDFEPLGIGVKVRVQDASTHLWDRLGTAHGIRDGHGGRSYEISSQGRILLRN